MSSEAYIFKIDLSRGLRYLYLVLGAGALGIGLEMAFFHFFTRGGNAGYTFGAWFLMVAGLLVFAAGVRSLIRPVPLFAVGTAGIDVRANPGPGRTLIRIPWQDIDDIGQGVIPTTPNRTPQPSLRVVLKQDAATEKERLTDATVHWHDGNVDINATYFSEDLTRVVRIVKIIRENPERFPEANLDFQTFVNRNPSI